MTTDAPAEKPADDFSALMGAIARLQHVIRSMGPQADVAEIRLKPTRHGRHEVERAIKMSPSFTQFVMRAQSTAQPPGMVCEVMGVKITIET
jgi:hypothetical protein